MNAEKINTLLQADRSGISGQFIPPVQDYELLERCVGAWQSGAAFRRERDRCKRFTFGDQWGDTVEFEGRLVSEAAYIRAQGNLPMKNNLIRRIVRNVLGVFRNQWTVPRCEARDSSEASQAVLMQELLNYNMELNCLEELYARTLEEFLISGMAVHKKWYGRRRGTCDCFTDCISPAVMLFDGDMGDVRGWDLNLIGELHDLSRDQILAAFGNGDPRREAWLIRNVIVPGGTMMTHELGTPRTTDFFKAAPGKCRVVEVWTLRNVRRWHCHDTADNSCYIVDDEDYVKNILPEMQRRAGCNEDIIEVRPEITEEWYYSFLSASGYILAEGKSPYKHRLHPYVFKMYPFIDGEIHSFVGDIIDQQKFTNRLISLYDWLIRSSAKGLLMFPEGSLPEGVDINDIAEEWTRFNGVIVYRPMDNVPAPQQISSVSKQAGIVELLDIQLKMMEDISGVNGALQGKLDNYSISGTLYNQQTRNSLTSLADILHSFNTFIVEATERDVSNIAQFYTRSKIEKTVGRKTGGITLEDTPLFGDSAVQDFRVSMNSALDNGAK